jgi:hypothetical protein
MLDFRPSSFKSLTLEHKWIWIFQKLFPEVPYNKIPSACTYQTHHMLHCFANICQVMSDEPPADFEVLKHALNKEIMEHYKIEILCGLPVLNFDDHFGGIFEKAVQDWKNGSAMEDVRHTTDTVVEKTAALNRSIYEPSTAGESMYLTPPPSATNPPCISRDNFKALNGLPVGSDSTTANLFPATIETPWMQNFNLDNLLSAAEPIQHSRVAPLAHNLQNHITDCVPNYNQYGTWVFVPSDSGPMLDMYPPLFVHNQSSPTWNSNSKTATEYNSINHIASNDQPALHLNSQEIRPTLSADVSPGLDLASLNIFDPYMGLGTQGDCGEAYILHSDHTGEVPIPGDDAIDFADIIDWSELDA